MKPSQGERATPEQVENIYAICPALQQSQFAKIRCNHASWPPLSQPTDIANRFLKKLAGEISPTTLNEASKHENMGEAIPDVWTEGGVEYSLKSDWRGGSSLRYFW